MGELLATTPMDALLGLFIFGVVLIGACGVFLIIDLCKDYTKPRKQKKKYTDVQTYKRKWW